MEVFVDFGLFELLAVAGIALIARKVYSKRWLALAFLILSLVAPIVLVIFVNEGLIRWIAVICLATALVNVSLIFLLIRRWDMSSLLDKQPASSPKLSGSKQSL
jgi:hypothetical protein